MKDGPSSLALNRKVPDHKISFFLIINIILLVCMYFVLICERWAEFARINQFKFKSQFICICM